MRAYRKNGVSSHKRVAMVEVVLHHRDERLEDFSLLQLAKETQRAAADVLVSVVEIIADVVGDQDHLWQQLAIWPMLLHYLPIHEQQLLNLVVFTRHTEADHSHEQLGHDLPVQEERYKGLKARHFLVSLLCFELLANLILTHIIMNAEVTCSSKDR